MPTSTATIANGQSLSGAVNLGTPVTVKGQTFDPTLMAVIPQAGWDTNDITFMVSSDGITYVDLYVVGSDGAASEFKITGAAASRCYAPLFPVALMAFRYLKIRSGTSGSPVNQSGAVDVLLVSRDL